nr:alpha/beta hydrolase [Lysinibacillus timonensis]
MPIHSYILQHLDHHSDERKDGIKIENPPEERRPSVYQIEEQTIPLPTGDISIKVYTPEKKDHYSLLVFFHEGNFISNDLELADIPCRMIASFSGHKVIAVNYSSSDLAHTDFLDRCYQTTKWIQNHANTFHSSRNDINICGASVGATITTSIVTKSIESGEISFDKQILFYPVTDLVETIDDSEYLSRKMYNAKYGVDIAKKQPQLTRFIDHSPINTSNDTLSKMPDTLIYTAEYDPYCDEGEAYAEKMKGAGANVKLIRFDGNIHGFMHIFPGSPDYMRGYEIAAEFLLKEDQEVEVFT